MDLKIPNKILLLLCKCKSKILTCIHAYTHVFGHCNLTDWIPWLPIQETTIEWSVPSDIFSIHFVLWSEMSFSYWLPPICKRGADTGNATANGILMDHGLPKVTRFSQKPNRPPRSDRCLIMPVLLYSQVYTGLLDAPVHQMIGCWYWHCCWACIHPYFVIEFKPQWHGVYRVAHSFLNSFCSRPCNVRRMLFPVNWIKVFPQEMWREASHTT